MHLNKLFTLLIAYWGVAFTPGLAQCNNPNIAFQSGEKVQYHAYYNWHFVWMNAGEVTFQVNQARWNKQPAYLIRATGTTYKNYDFFYKVRDTFEVVVDTTTLEPYRFRQLNYEGNYYCDNNYLFHRNPRKITGTIEKNQEPIRNIQIPWPHCSFDLLSMVYRARNIPYEKHQPGTKIPIRMLVEGDVYALYIRYLGKENIKTRDGRHFRCLKFKPLLVEGTIFKGGEDMTVWVTDDRNRVPILVEAKVLIGSVKAIFQSATGLRFPMEAEIIK